MMVKKQVVHHTFNIKKSLMCLQIVTIKRKHIYEIVRDILSLNYEMNASEFNKILCDEI